jgi:hypothetical protein
MSDRECSSSSDSSGGYNESTDSSGSGSDEYVLDGEFLPYQNEPVWLIVVAKVIMMMKETKMGSPRLF